MALGGNPSFALLLQSSACVLHTYVTIHVYLEENVLQSHSQLGIVGT